MDDKPTKIPRGKLGRGAVIGGAAAKVGVKKAAHFGKRPFLSEERRLQADRENDAEAAKIIFDALSVLRGTALKAAQFIAMEIEMLPEAYRQELSKASSQVPPMNRALVRKIVRSELGPPEKRFRKFDLRSFAAASLGQVHAAEILEGASVAVKLQYPGIAEGVTTDIDLLKRVLAPTRYYRIFANCFSEIQNRVHEELDYRKEAEFTERFADAVPTDRYVLPQVFHQLSTPRVLTTSRIDGCHLSEWLAQSPSQAMRDHFGQLLVDFFNLTAFGQLMIHADPNPGNYLFREDGRLGVIDFGCVVRVDRGFAAAMARLLRSETRTDIEVEEMLHERVGIHYRKAADPEAFAAFFTDWVQWLKEPYSENGYDFIENNDYFERGQVYADEFQRYIDHYDGGFVYFGRTMHGIMRILQQLGARVRMAPPEIS